MLGIRWYVWYAFMVIMLGIRWYIWYAFMAMIMIIVLFISKRLVDVLADVTIQLQR